MEGINGAKGQIPKGPVPRDARVASDTDNDHPTGGPVTVTNGLANVISDRVQPYGALIFKWRLGLKTDGGFPGAKT